MTILLFNGDLAAAQVIGLIRTVVRGVLSDGY
jgi:hypothetical protein